MASLHAFPSPRKELRDLPLFDWAEGRYLLTREGKKLERWGTVKKARAILDGCGKREIYDLIEAGLIAGYKLNPQVANSHWKVDLLSVWEHKQSQLRSRAMMREGLE